MPLSLLNSPSLAELTTLFDFKYAPGFQAVDFLTVAAYGTGTFVVMGGGLGANLAYTSPDGITWTQRNLPIGGASWADICFGGGLFVAVHSGNQCVTSPDGINWTARNMPSNEDWVAVAHNGTVFCAINGTGNVAATSPNGIVWTAQVLPSSGGLLTEWTCISGTNGTFVAVPNNLKFVAISNDGAIWSQSEVLPVARAWENIIWDGQKIIVANTVGSRGLALSNTLLAWLTAGDMVISYDAVHWEYHQLFSQYPFVTTPNENDWTERYLLTGGAPQSVASNGTRFIVTMFDGRIQYSREF